MGLLAIAFGLFKRLSLRPIIISFSSVGVVADSAPSLSPFGLTPERSKDVVLGSEGNDWNLVQSKSPLGLVKSQEKAIIFKELKQNSISFRNRTQTLFFRP